MNATPPANTTLRVGIWFVAAVMLIVGAVATLTPRTFYDHVPWVSLNPPYSEHLMRDYGAMNLALALMMVVAAITMERLIIRATLTAYLVFATTSSVPRQSPPALHDGPRRGRNDHSRGRRAAAVRPAVAHRPKWRSQQALNSATSAVLSMHRVLAALGMENHR